METIHNVFNQVNFSEILKTLQYTFEVDINNEELLYAYEDFYEKIKNSNEHKHIIFNLNPDAFFVLDIEDDYHTYLLDENTKYDFSFLDLDEIAKYKTKEPKENYQVLASSILYELTFFGDNETRMEERDNLLKMTNALNKNEFTYKEEVCIFCDSIPFKKENCSWCKGTGKKKVIYFDNEELN